MAIVQLQHLTHLDPNSAIERTSCPRRKGTSIMAYVNSTSTTSGTFAERFLPFIKDMRLGLERRRIYNRTVQELRALSTRDLADLGLSREMITRVALEAAYGK
jgi:uncharacterized protein YjiS (DUF1127 family)